MLPPARSYEDSRRAFRWHVPETFNAAADLVDRQCSPGSDPDRTALIATLTDGSTAHFSYADLKRLSDLLAAVFVGRLVERESRVATLLPQGLEAALCAVAALKAGGVIAPMDADWSADTLAAAFRAARPRVVVTARDRLETARAALAAAGLSPAVLCVNPDDESGADDFWAALYGAPPLAARVATAAADPAFLVFSQGRTGEAKAILHAHRAVLGHLPGLEMVFDEAPRAGDVAWCAASAAHPAAMISGLFGFWALGIPVLALDPPQTPADAEAAFAAIGRHGVRLALLTPQAIDGLRRFPEPRAHYSFALRAVACIGGRAPRQADEWSRRNLGLPLGRLYGEAETGPIAATHPHWYADADDAALGRAIPGVSLDIVDADGERLSLGAVGNLAVARNHPGLCLGHVGERTDALAWERRKFVGDWFVTDDLASMDEDGNLRFVAKSDDILPHDAAGFLPDDVERILRSHRMVRDAAVIALTGATGAEIVAAIALNPDLPRGDAAADALIAADILALAERSLAAYARPQRLVFVTAIPRTDEGRAHRAHLRRLLIRAADKANGRE